MRETAAWKKAAADKDREALDKLRADAPKVDRAAFATRAQAFADARKGDERAVGLAWIVRNGPAENAGAALDAMIADHLGSPAMREYVESRAFVYGLGRLDPAKHAARLEKIKNGAASPELKGWATWADALRLAGSKTKEDQAKSAALLEDAERLAKGTELADRIAAPRFEKERLQIGMVAPDIEGLDVNGNPMKLSDQRGKVTVLDFWGDW